MTSILDAINNSLADSNQNIVTLTNPNYDADLITIQEDIDVSIRIDLKIESQAMSGDGLIWGHPTRGIWYANKWSSAGSIGFILGSSIYGKIGVSQLGSNASAYQTVQELTSV